MMSTAAAVTLAPTNGGHVLPAPPAAAPAAPAEHSGPPSVVSDSGNDNLSASGHDSLSASGHSLSASGHDSLSASGQGSLTASGRRTRRVQSQFHHTLIDSHSHEALEPSCLETVSKLGEGGYAIVDKAW